MEPDEDGVVVPVSDQPSGQGGGAKPPESDDKVDVNASHDSKAASGTSSVSSDPPENDGEPKNTDSEKPKKDPPKDDDSGDRKPPADSSGGGNSTTGPSKGESDGTDVPEQTLSQRQQRSDLIQVKLVDQHDQTNTADIYDIFDEANLRSWKREPAAIGNADKFGDGLGYLGIASGIAGNISSMVDTNEAKKAAGITGMAGGAIGFVTSAIKSGTSIYRAKRTKSRYARKDANTKTASGALGMIGGLSGMAGSLLGLTDDGSEGTDNSKKATIAQGGFGALKGVMDAIGSGLDFKASNDEKNAHREIDANAGTISSGMSIRNQGQHRDLDQELEDARHDIEIQKNLRKQRSQQFDPDILKEAKRRRHTAKARKYAMKQAADMHSARAGESRKNVGNLVGGIFGGLGGVLSGLSKILDPGGGLLGSVLKYIGAGSSLIGNLSKGIGKYVDKNRASNESEALKGNKQNVVDEYLNEKADRIIKEANSVRLSPQEQSQYHVSEFPKLTDEEAKKIAVLRLGITDDNRVNNVILPLSPKNYERAFQIITEKRAKNILKSEDADKNEMLDALGLDHDASLEDVVSSLSGNIS